MSGYLKRLVTRGGSDSGAAGVLPVVRSRSPIAEHDQRVGIPGFGNPNFDPPTSIEPTLGDSGAAASLPDLQVPSATQIGAAGRRLLQRKAESSAAANEQATPGDAAAAGQVISTRPATHASPDVGASAWSPSSALRLDTRPLLHDRATDSHQAEVSRRDAGEIAANARTRLATSRAERLPAYDVNIDESAVGPERSARVTRPLLDPTPRTFTSRQLREPMSSDPLDRVDEREQEPRVVIGRINVEVVPPAAEPRTSTQSRNGPLTAESVSVIGPLTRHVQSGRRLSLKYR